MGIMIGHTKADTRSLDYSSYGPLGLSGRFQGLPRVLGTLGGT